MPNTIICPKCKTEIEVTEALSSQLRDELREQYEAEARRKEQEFVVREDAIKHREAALATAQESIDQQVEAKLADGVLTVTCPKAPEAQPHKVQVRSA